MSWQENYQRKLCTAEEAVRQVKSGDRVIQGQMHGVSQVLVDALCARKNELEEVTVFSSINFSREPYITEDYRPHIGYLNGFLFPAARKAFQAGRIEYLQIHFSQFPVWLREIWRPTVAMPVLTLLRKW